MKVSNKYRILLYLLICPLLPACARRVHDTSPAPSEQVHWENNSLEDLVQLLRHDEPATRVKAARSLAAFGPDNVLAIQSLAEALKDDSKIVKETAGIAMISFDERALPALHQLAGIKPHAQTNSPNPRKSPVGDLTPVEMLVYIDPWFAGALIPSTLEAAQTNNPPFRPVALRALGVIGKYHLKPIKNPYDSLPAELLETLKEAADDPDENVRTAARDSLEVLSQRVSAIKRNSDQ